MLFNMIDGINGLVLLVLSYNLHLILLFQSFSSSPDNLFFVAIFFAIYTMYLLYDLPNTLLRRRIFTGGDGGAYFLGTIMLAIRQVK